LTVTLDERLRYHPDPNRQKGSRRSKRRVDGRCRIIEERVDLSGKRLLDLGCSGGYFGFELADVVSSYFGVDADDVVIERNRSVAQQRSLINLEFHRATITPSFVRSLPPMDVALFLSVFHHILATSTAYAWNRPPDFDPFDLLRALQERVDVLVFETGYPGEGFEWCERLPPMTPTPRTWVEQVLRNAGFRHVEVVPADTYKGAMDGVRRRIALTLGYAKHPRPLSGRIASRILRVDPRDNRDLFFASNSPLRSAT
jgi:SAM-dependent methyltransferase